jgi:hypothetical protein
MGDTMEYPILAFGPSKRRRTSYYVVKEAGKWHNDWPFVNAIVFLAWDA